MAFMGTGALGNIAHADALTKAKRNKLSPNDILELMKKGNKRFYTGKREDHNFLAQQRASAKGQYPAAILLTCIDSRAPAETILDLRIGDIFNSRVAGNVANSDILGSIEFACKLAGAKVVLVMGHTACGAIKGAIDDAELGNLTGLLAKIRPAVAATRTPAKGRRRITHLLTLLRGRMSKLRWPTFARTVLCWPQWSRMAVSRSLGRCTIWRQVWWTSLLDD
jgi:carbonic anhydrase